MKLIIQPEDGVTPLVKAIDGARNSIQLSIFRCDRDDIQQALTRAVIRGVSVHALFANTNRGGERELRKLETEFLAAGIQVARTSDDLLRYHYKFMIIDRETLYLLTFNFTHLEIGGIRSFGIISQDRVLVLEAERLFEADVKRQSYSPQAADFVVSPVNARIQLSLFVERAKQQLLIYDPEISDRRMIRLLRARRKAGVEIRVIGRVRKGSKKYHDSHLASMRFHTRSIIRDGQVAFIGSQSLREAELDRRRELGLIIHDREIVRSLLEVFERDWASLMVERHDESDSSRPADRELVRKAKAVIRELPLSPLVRRAMEKALKDFPHRNFALQKFGHRLEDAVGEALEDAISHALSRGLESEVHT